MISPNNLPAKAKIYIRDKNVTVEGKVYEGVMAFELLSELVKVLSFSHKEIKTIKSAHKKIVRPTINKRLTQKYLWEKVESFLQERDLICVENGTSLTGINNIKLPNGVKLISQPIWGAIGYSLPALLGCMSADNTRRSILFIGDGSFQMTADLDYGPRGPQNRV